MQISALWGATVRQRDRAETEASMPGARNRLQVQDTERRGGSDGGNRCQPVRAGRIPMRESRAATATSQAGSKWGRGACERPLMRAGGSTRAAIGNATVKAPDAASSHPHPGSRQLIEAQGNQRG